MVYFITDGEYFKIGSSKNPEKRLLELQTANARPLKLFATVEGGVFVERIYQNVLSDVKVINEWFDVSEEEVSNIISAISADMSDWIYVSDNVPFILEKAKDASTYRLWS